MGLDKPLKQSSCDNLCIFACQVRHCLLKCSSEGKGVFGRFRIVNAFEFSGSYKVSKVIQFRIEGQERDIPFQLVVDDIFGIACHCEYSPGLAELQLRSSPSPNDSNEPYYIGIGSLPVRECVAWATPFAPQRLPPVVRNNSVRVLLAPFSWVITGKFCQKGCNM